MATQHGIIYGGNAMAQRSQAAKDDLFWSAVLERNTAYDGVVFYAVRSTGVYCRPSCPSRRPRRNGVEFFTEPAMAERAGYRACRRCQPNRPHAGCEQFELVRRVCRYIEQNLDSSLTLEELARISGLSPTHLQKVFKRATGVSPRQYIQARRMAVLKIHLRVNRRPVTDAIYEAGFGSSSRVYERAATFIGMSPARYSDGAPGVKIRYTILECSLGDLLLAATDKGVCSVKVGDGGALERELFAEYRKAAIERDDASLRDWATRLLEVVEKGTAPPALPLDIQATAFQQRVYEALRRIPLGEVRSYNEVARAVELPSGARAVARACATNPVALLIPCHRVVRADGVSGGYRWGAERKHTLLEREKRAAGARQDGTATSASPAVHPARAAQTSDGSGQSLRLSRRTGSARG